jgi:N-acetylglucosamine kinase-like BadF-type ATPase
LTGSDLPVAAVTGGGTTTECAVVDPSGAVIGQARSGPSNPNFVPLEEARANVAAALAAALDGIDRCRAAGVALFDRVAGDGDRAATEVLAPLTRRTSAIRRYTEHEAALASCGILQTEGVAVVAGTGSSAVAMRGGRRAIAGGWGTLLGDQGSAYDIGMWAVRSAIQSHERTGPPMSVLEQRVTTHLGVGSLADLVPLFYRSGVARDRVADLCRVIAPDAADEPAVAARFALAGRELASLAVAAADRLYTAADSPVFAMSGGVWGAGAVIEEPFMEAVCRAYPRARFRPQLCRPAVGLARRVLQEEVDP